MSVVEEKVTARLKADPYLEPYRGDIQRRVEKVAETERRLLGGDKRDLLSFASGHEYFGLHRTEGGWVMREWAPYAEAIYLKGSFNGWKRDESLKFSAADNGNWELKLPAESLNHGDTFRLEVFWPGGSGERIPAWIRRVAQDPSNDSFNAQVWQPESPYVWKHEPTEYKGDPLLVYEAHIGMAQEREGVGTYNEFRENVLPRIREGGYNAIQLMALAEHPYYASFGYQVSNFFACSSRFGTPEELKALVDEAHGMGLTVLMDLIHSHAVKNEVEGIGRFDGSGYQYFHEGARGDHPAWDSRCFDYAKPEVLHFLLSNCRFWMDEYRFDGFRFDGVTSMLYTHHGLGKAFVSYDDYFEESVDEDALTYLTLANRLVHGLRPDAVTIAEDVSGMPGLAAAEAVGGVGFDYRYAMNVADYWIKLVKDSPDEGWPIGGLWHELTNRRSDEKTISYAESHDQALVGDQTLMFRLAKDRMYDKMTIHEEDPNVFRAVSLHKMIRLATLASAGHGYLNFMGNEFGHPEWIDFPREGNGWSYRYARRQWSLADNGELRYQDLASFDRALLSLASAFRLPAGGYAELSLLHEDDKVLAFRRASLLFVFNFHPEKSFSDYHVPVPPGRFQIVLDTDRPEFGGHGRQDIEVQHEAMQKGEDHRVLSLYLPSRSAIVLKPL